MSVLLAIIFLRADILAAQPKKNFFNELELC